MRNPELLRQARTEPVIVELHQLMPEGFDLMHSILSDTVPSWLVTELEWEGLTLRFEHPTGWVLASLDE